MRNRIGVLGLCLMLSAGSLNAQNFALTNGHGLPKAGKSAVVWADFNADGWQDAAISGIGLSGQKMAAVYLNQGNGTFINASAGLLPVSEGALAVADVDRDGDIDLLASGLNAAGVAESKLYLNNGNALFTPSALSLPGLFKGSLSLSDLNNDGRLDLYLAGLNSSLRPAVFIYWQQENGSFTEGTASLGALAPAKSQLVDFNGDRYTDILMVGIDASGQRKAQLWLNQQNEQFRMSEQDLPALRDVVLSLGSFSASDNLPDLFLAGNGQNGLDTAIVLTNNGLANFNLQQILPELANGASAVADFNASGTDDLLYAGYHESNYVGYLYEHRNTGWTQAIVIPGLVQGSLSVVDFNNDQQPDFFLSGYAQAGISAYLYQNQYATTNTAPAAPSGLQALAVGDSVRLSWTAPADDHTASEQLTYELYLGTAAGLDNVRTAEADLASGYRRVQQKGSYWQNEALLKNLPEGRYYWSVQAIDGCLQGSAFAAEGSFVVCYKPNLGEDQLVCRNDEVTLSQGTTGDVVNWYEAAGGNLLQANSLTYTHTVSEPISLVVEVTKPLGCTLTDTLNIMPLDLPQSGLNPSYDVCRGQSLSLALPDEIGQANWYNHTTGELLLENSHRYAFEVMESVMLRVDMQNAAGCAASERIEVNALALPEPDLGADLAICFGEDTQISLPGSYASINWYSSLRGALGNGLSEIAYADVRGADTLWVEVSNANGCIQRDTLLINVNDLPLADAGEDQTFCKGSSLIIGGAYEDQAGLSFSWQPAAYVNDPALPNPTVTVQESTDFILTVTNAQGCVNTDTVRVILDTPSTIDAGSDRYICYGESTQLGGEPTASGSQFAYSFQWQPAESLDDPTSPNPIAMPQQTTTYRLLTSTGECVIDTAYVTVEVKALPVVTVSQTVTIGAGETTQLSVAGGSTYYWYPNIALSDFTAAQPLANPTESTLYYVLVTDEFGCQQRDSVQVLVKNDLFMPELFTPNGDGQNDYYPVFGAGIEEISFTIYDRQGNVLFQTDRVEEALNQGWDGTHQGEPVPNGVYLWSIKGSFYDGRPLQYKGNQSGTFKLLR